MGSEGILDNVFDEDVIRDIHLMRHERMYQFVGGSLRRVSLGYGVTILPGVNIGNNVIVGAGAVAANVIPSNCVAVGVPAKPVKTLEEYWRQNEKNVISTRGMVYRVKKDNLSKYFSRA